MQIFDNVIKEVNDLLSGEYSYCDDIKVNKEFLGKKNELVLASEAAFELGAAKKDSVTFFSVCQNEELVKHDEILIYGDDLDKIHEDCSFARITIVRIKDNLIKDNQATYNIIENIDLKKYDVAPLGYMLRASAFSSREQIRVSKKSIKKGLSFFDVGSQFINEYKKHKDVEAVKVIFITDANFNYSKLSVEAKKAQDLIKAMNTIMNDLDFDCKHCEWKVVCDDTPGMRELHKKYMK